MRRVLPYLIGSGLVFFGWQKYREKIEAAASGGEPPSAEALYFLENCPGTKMDGDRDGLPCEDQWCAHLR